MVLVVEHWCELGGADSPPSSIIYNGSENLAIANDGTRSAQAEEADFSSCSIWEVKNPSTGTHNVVVTEASAQHCGLAVYLLENVDQTTPVRDVRTNHAGSGTSDTLTHSGMASGDLALDVLSIDSTGHAAAVSGTGHSKEWGTLDFGGGTNEGQGGSNTDTGGAMGWTWTTSKQFCHVSVAFAAVTSSASPQTVTGVGAIRRPSIFIPIGH